MTPNSRFCQFYKCKKNIFFQERRKMVCEKKHHCHTMWIRGDEPVSDHKVHPGHNIFGMTTYPTKLECTSAIILSIYTHILPTCVWSSGWSISFSDSKVWSGSDTDRCFVPASLFPCCYNAIGALISFRPCSTQVPMVTGGHEAWLLCGAMSPWNGPLFGGAAVLLGLSFSTSSAVVFMCAYGSICIVRRIFVFVAIC